MRDKIRASAKYCLSLSGATYARVTCVTCARVHRRLRRIIIIATSNRRYYLINPARERKGRPLPAMTALLVSPIQFSRLVENLADQLFFDMAEERGEVAQFPFSRIRKPQIAREEVSRRCCVMKTNGYFYFVA